jgi:hypothetical protein
MENNDRPRSGSRHATSRDQELITELSALARNGAPIERDDRKTADQWSTVRFYPMLMVVGLGVLSVGVGAVCLPPGFGSYVAVAVFFFVLLTAVLAMNSKHREAYVERQMANGMSRSEAEREYSNRYDGS